MAQLFGSRTRTTGAEDPCIFHITHYKAGSQWVYAVLATLAKDRIVTPEAGAAHCTRGGIASGMIYPCVYLKQEQFRKVNKPKASKCFIVIRDLRDTLVSQYFSVKASHKIMNAQMQKTRDRLNSMCQSDGLMLVNNNLVYISADIQKSWCGKKKKHLLVRYEDLIADEHKAFNVIFDYCGFSPDPDVRGKAIEAHSFEKRTGRKRGEEDAGSHHRKGIAGDWRNYFDDKLKNAFKQRYAQLLIDTGYETDDAW